MAEEVKERAPQDYSSDDMGDHATAMDMDDEEGETSMEQLSPAPSPAFALDDGFQHEAGIIEKVYVENFMCHQKLTVELGRQVNFITGANGSGKSAIVAAIQLCLGCSANKTGRGKQLAEYIRTGSGGPAILRLTLINTGLAAYLPHEYGNRIMVERRIPKSGAASYQLMDSRGVVKATKKKEIDRMLNWFNTDVENPTCVLTQDEAKKFIQGKDKDKYSFFLKATLLEKTEEQIHEIESSIEFVEQKRTAAKDRKRLKRAELEEMKRKREELEQAEKIQDDIEAVLVDMKWATAKGEIEHLDRLQTEINKQADLHQLAKDKVKEQELVIEALPGLEDKQDQLKEVEAQIESINSELVPKRAAAAVTDRTINQHNRTLQEKSREIQQKDRLRRDASRQVDELRAKAMGSAQEEERGLLARAQEIENKQQELFDDVAKLEATIESARHRDRDAHAQVTDITAQIRTHRESKQRLVREVEQLRLQTNSRAAAFGSRADEVLQKIDQERHKFQGPVIGPVGLYVTLNELGAHFRDGVERIVGGRLQHFIVTCSGDLARLLRILRGLNVRDHQIAQQSNVPRYNIRKIAGAQTVNDMLNVTHDLVFNFLIDQTQMESVVVCESESECEARFITNDSGGERFTNKDIVSCVTKNGVLVAIRGGNRGSQAYNNNKRRIGMDVTERITDLQNQIEFENEQIEAMGRDQRYREQTLAAVRQEIAVAESALKRVRNEIRQFSVQANQIKSQLDEARANMNVDTGPLEEEIARLSEQITELEEEKFNAQTALEELKTLQLHQKQVVMVAQNDWHAANDRLQELQVSLQTFMVDLERETDELDRRQRKVDDIISHLAKLQSGIEPQQKVVDDALANARAAQSALSGGWNGADRLDVAKALKDLKQELAKLQKRKEREERRVRESRTHVTLEMVLEQLDAAQKDYDNVAQEAQKLKEEVSRLIRDVELRKKNLRNIRKHNSHMVATMFDAYMQAKGFSGTVKFDHETRELGIRARTDNQDTSSQIEDVRQLSGGERSYTTLALLLALGHVIDCPFRMLDEYDVFMDQVARTITLRQLVEYAKDPNQKGRQFIIITPQSLSGLTDDPCVKISRLSPPQRT